MYQINDASGPYLGEPRTLKNSGREPMYPFRDMYVGQWIRVPYVEEFRLLRAVRNIRRKGIVMAVNQERPVDGDWIVFRTK